LSFPFFKDAKEVSPESAQPFGSGLTEYVIKTGKPLLLNKKDKDEYTRKGLFKSIGVASELWMGAPLSTEKRIIGVIALNSYDDPNLYDDSDLKILTFVSEQIALAIEYNQSTEDLHKSEERYRTLSEELTDSNSMKGLLLDVIAHDLKNPAGAIKGFAEFGLENDPNNEILDEINQSTDSLLNVINGATTLSKLTLGDAINKEELNLVNIINRIIRENKAQLQIEEMTLNMKLKGELLVNANPIICEVFRNYISNAIKYAMKGKIIIIDATEEDGYVTINVKDFGKTINKKDRENIFTRNVQLGKTDGRGLGLAIVKRIAKAHDAKVGVKPNKPKGNNFYIKFST